MFKRLISAALAGIFIAGCGGGKGVSDTLFTLSAGKTWTYRFSGNVELPPGLGGGIISANSNASTLQFVVTKSVGNDLDGNPVDALDRNFSITLADGRVITGKLRLYVSQNETGIFVHGVDARTTGDFVPADAKFVPGTVTPAFRFAWLPNPALDGQTIQYTNPLNLSGTGDHSYKVELGVGRTEVNVPAGTFLAKGSSLTEAFSSFTLTNAAFVPDRGFMNGLLTVTLPNGAKLNGVIVLTGTN